MNALLTSIIQYAVLLSIPLLCALVVWLSHQLVRSLPTHQREALEQFARIAVQQIEQQSGTLSGAAKKELAINLVIKMFNIFKIPAPPVEIIDIAIEAAVFFINQIPTVMSAAKQSGPAITDLNTMSATKQSGPAITTNLNTMSTAKQSGPGIDLNKG